MLHSQAIIAIIERQDGKHQILVRQDYEHTLNMWSFTRNRKLFDTDREAKLYAMKRYPQVKLVTFDELTAV